jgi:protein-S-isoprenylcysteine O-methyltransferase Ste14
MGAWLFRHRGVLPVPLLILLVGVARPSAASILGGSSLMLLGELLRLWGVGHIGARSRTRTPEVGGLVQSGPFRFSRNPLYIGNILLFCGVATWSGRPALLGLTLVLLCLHYGLIVRWEESRLRQTHGDAFVQYCRRTGRWVGPPGTPSSERADWVAALASERSTLGAIGLTTLALGMQT